jgi:hypothetical protein
MRRLGWNGGGEAFWAYDRRVLVGGLVWAVTAAHRRILQHRPTVQGLSDPVTNRGNNPARDRNYTGWWLVNKLRFSIKKGK